MGEGRRSPVSVLPLGLPARRRAVCGSGALPPQFPFVQSSFLPLSTQKQAWQPCRDATGMNPAPTQLVTGWGSWAKQGLSYTWTRGPTPMCPSLGFCMGGQGPGGLMAWPLSYPQGMPDQTLSPVGLLPA